LTPVATAISAVHSAKYATYTYMKAAYALCEIRNTRMSIFELTGFANYKNMSASNVACV